jgi:hypothetical protein
MAMVPFAPTPPQEFELVNSSQMIATVVVDPQGFCQAWCPFLLLYVSPDQILPFMSFLGAAVGVVLMFWNRLVGVFRRQKKPSTDQ